MDFLAELGTDLNQRNIPEQKPSTLSVPSG